MGDEKEADGGLGKDGRARESVVQYNRAAICALQHYGKCSKEKEGREAIMLRDGRAK